MKEYKYGKKAIIIFFALVIALSAAVDVLYCGGGPEWLVLLLMWIPGLSGAVASCIAIKENGEEFTLKGFNSRLGIRVSKLKYILMGILLPLIYLLIPYIIYWCTHPDNFAYSGVSIWLILKDCMPMMVIGIFIGLLSALGEELGWRGFMVPALNERSGMNMAINVSSLFWCLWHFPLLMGSDYMTGTPLWYKLSAFVLCIMPVGIICGILALESGSVWPSAFLHAAHNNYDQAVFGVITRGDDMMYYVSETGILTIVCAWILAIIMYRRYKKKFKNEEEKDYTPA